MGRAGRNAIAGLTLCWPRKQWAPSASVPTEIVEFAGIRSHDYTATQRHHRIFRSRAARIEPNSSTVAAGPRAWDKDLMQRHGLVLTQLRGSSEYNDFVGRFYHFPEKYIGHFRSLPIEFVYYEGSKNGAGVYFGYGKIEKDPIPDKREPGHYFVEISDYKPFLDPVSHKDAEGKQRESISPHFNPQNAVRKIPTALLEEICLDGKIRLNFQADAHLIKVLGEQLIASEKVGILELIKNAYDAGASTCVVRIEDVPQLPGAGAHESQYSNLPGPVIVVEDNGTGMTRDVIENGWLRPASTIKTVVKETIKQEHDKAVQQGTLGAFQQLIREIKKERGGRIPLGEKGVGRFACHRLGRRLLVKSKIKDLDYEYLLEVDWDKFDGSQSHPRDLEEIGVSLSRQAPSRNYGKENSGTQLVIYGGREGFAWNATTITELHRSIMSLNSPYPSPSASQSEIGFTAKLECPQLGPFDNEPLSLAFPPTFSFDGVVDDNGSLDYTLRFLPPKSVPMPEQTFNESGFDLRKANISFWKSPAGDALRMPECGSFYMHVDVWYRKSPWIESAGPDGKEFLSYLTNFGGISIFRDRINIFPAEWGTVTDWLGLSTRHIKKGSNMSYYNMIGNVEIDQSANISLIDKTNREGLIENQASKDLKQLVNVITLAIIENEFKAKREEYENLVGDTVRDPRILGDYAKQGAAIITEIKNKYPVADDPYDILQPIGTRIDRTEGLINLSRSLRNLQKSIELIEEAQDLFTEQAGYGMAVAVSVHEIAKIASNFYSGVSHILKSGNNDPESLKSLKEASASLQSELKRLSPLRAIRNETQTEFQISKVIRFALEVFRSRFDQFGISVEMNGQETFDVYGRYGALIQVFSNLFDNSCYWLNMVERGSRKIRIHITSSPRMVIVGDSGPGIDNVIAPYLFQPGYSLRVPPSGLGLYVCRYYMQSMNGNAYVSVHSERLSDLSGAQFTLDFRSVPRTRPVREARR